MSGSVPSLAEPVTSFVESEDSVRVAVHDYGGAGAPVVFVHGTGLCSRMWEPVIARLPVDRIRPLAVDLRGHGSSSRPIGGRFEDHRMVADLCSVIDAFGLDGAAVAAHSMGAATAILSTLARPGAFDRVWAYEPIVFEHVEPRPEGLIAMLEATRRRRVEFPDRATVIERYGSRPPLDELDPACLAAYVDHGFVDLPEGGVRLACHPDDEAATFEDFLQDGWERLPSVTAAVRVAFGARKLDRAGELAPTIAERIPGADAECFPDSGHFGPFGDLDRASSSITEWCIDRI